ncbi:XkdX family protein [Domibacillus aminovorans]
MDWFTSIKRFYPKYWTKSMVGDAVVAGKITEAQYKEITGDDYVSTA